MFAKPDAWGKNQFNSAFPASLLCWMGVNHISPVYLYLEAGKFLQKPIAVADLLGLPPLHSDLFFAFEDAYTPYSDLLVGVLPRADLVLRNHNNPHKIALAAFEIKLTALPDNTTYNQQESEWSCEIVVRPDTIVYLALSIAHAYRNQREQLMWHLKIPALETLDFSLAQQIQPYIPELVSALESAFDAVPEAQTPILLQPIFKTQGKKSILDEQCFDCFVCGHLFLSPERRLDAIIVNTQGLF